VSDTKCDIPSSEIFRILLQDRRYIKMDIQEVGLGGGGRPIDWIDLAQDKDMWRAVSCKRCNKPSSSIKCGEFLD
jgi:hypothetical protein